VPDDGRRELGVLLGFLGRPPPLKAAIRRCTGGRSKYSTLDALPPYELECAVTK